jgi:FixJ family two-component response regulator
MHTEPTDRPIVLVVDDDREVRESLANLLRSVDLRCEAFPSTQDFLQRAPSDEPSCLILDVRLPGHSGLDFQQALTKAQINIPIIFISGHGDVPMTVRAMKAGAFGFFTKPLHEQDLLDTIQAAIDHDRAQRELGRHLMQLRKRFEELSPRERQVMALVASGLMNKQAAVEIGLSEVTVKFHRHNIMKKLGLKSLADLVRVADMLGDGHNKTLSEQLTSRLGALRNGKSPAKE